ncbi:GntR family transcriptional regulator [Alloalcanivorax xenomutans]|uniref:GntR family transcriptional regulator n=1 Tax=Alloalcanivorax xenomutans TaxID=1094342 RepID=UPI0024E23D13|nr:GntR family transcriptional regulator [Alloalcanivorax xenomutans]WOD30017.1 GntR family transcriptional regulator [Alloalcanivorax xenomutans]|tara:strand:+ start:164 stop:562 length:399 start_codon:yes stop_codon:yes gene_type:complete
MMTLDDFEIHDISAFPVVRFFPESLPEGYALRWEEEMDALIAQPEPFVVLLGNAEVAEETHQDRKRRTLWLKRNRDALARACKGMVGVQPNAAKRLVMQTQSAALAGLFNVPLRVVASVEEAERLGRVFLSE